MSELHYANLGISDYSYFMKNVFYGLTPLYQYLITAENSVKQQRESLRWERAEKPDTNIVNSRQEEGHDGYVLQLLPLSEENDDQYTFDKFLNEKRIYDGDTYQDPIKVLSSDEERNTIAVSRLPRGPLIHYRPNAYTIWRQKEALYALQNIPHPDHLPLLMLFRDSRSAQWPAFDNLEVAAWKKLTFAGSPGTDEEKEFVEKALATPDFAILEGPPGSGKTITICELIIQAVQRGKRILLCASTHVAVDNVLERLIDEPSVIAVRIGDEKTVSKEVEPYILSRLAGTERKRLTAFLVSRGQRSKSQDYLLRNLQDSSRDEVTGRENGDLLVEQMVLDAANLVCGTTIGILQHPMIKEGRQQEPAFDMMILDEASKTTFQEFLVPALYARRWILSGDKRQLSPYVEMAEIEGNLAGLLDSDIRDACVDVFMASQVRDSKASSRGGTLVCSDGISAGYWARQGTSRGIPVFQLPEDGPLGIGESLELFGSPVCVGTSKAISVHERIIPGDLSTVRGSVPSLPVWRNRRDFIHNTNNHNDYFDDEETRWEKEVAWRLVRMFELRRTPGNPKRERYINDIQELMPAFGENQNREELGKCIENIRRMALPSVLELLQDGFETGGQGNRNCAITDGLPEVCLTRRHTRLEYQQRMHPDIAEFPREHIYIDDSGRQIGLLDPSNIRERRKWSYREYGDKRCVWIDVKPTYHARRNSNPEEADALIKEYETFLDWARVNKRDDGREWEVAALTFYKSQERILARLFQRLSGSQNWRNFRDPYGATKIQVCTVDRFQGQEADVVFLSFARTRGTGFLDSVNRLNVALTRARYLLVILGYKRNFELNSRSGMLRALARKIASPIRWQTN